MIDPDAIQARFDALEPFLNERDRRLFAASEARAAGRGGIAAVSRTTGMARSTIGRGLADLRSGAVRCSDRVRRMGGGQKPATETQPGILEALTQLSYRYASDSRNAPENCGLLRPLSICGAKNHCPFRGHLALTGSTLMCWRRCSRNAVRTVGRRKSRLDHRFSLGALQSELPPPWHVWCLNRSAPHNALISSHIFSSGGKVGFE